MSSVIGLLTNSGAGGRACPENADAGRVGLQRSSEIGGEGAGFEASAAAGSGPYRCRRAGFPVVDTVGLV